MYCSGSALKDPVTSLIQSLGNTKVLSREVESKLTKIIRKGLDMEVSIVAREAKLKRPLSVSEVVQLLVSPCEPPAESFGALYMTQAFISCTKVTQRAGPHGMLCDSSSERRGDLQGLKSEEHVLLVRKNATEARDLLIQHNVRLVISMAKNYRWCGVELQDLIQEGIMGLVRAIDRFDPDRGFKFSTYAHWWIRQVPLPSPC